MTTTGITPRKLGADRLQISDFSIQRQPYAQSAEQRRAQGLIPGECLTVSAVINMPQDSQTIRNALHYLHARKYDSAIAQPHANGTRITMTRTLQTGEIEPLQSPDLSMLATGARNIMLYDAAELAQAIGLKEPGKAAEKLVNALTVGNNEAPAISIATL